MSHASITLIRDCDAVQIPSGDQIHLPAGTEVVVTQSLGGSYTVATPSGLAKIAGRDADALGMKGAVEEGSGAMEGLSGEAAVWEALKTCYDPEIPVNIVDLGLVYDCKLIANEGRGASVEVKMTLTAPGCGMGPTIAAEAESRIICLDGIDEAKVELIWDPPWDQGMISEAGRMKLGMV